MTTCLTIALALTTAIAAEAADVTATRLDGHATAGRLQSWDNSAVVLITDKGKERIAADELLSLRRPDSTTAPAAETTLPPVVELIDGTLLPIDDFRRTGKEATLWLHGSLPTEIKVVTLPDGLISAVRLQTLAGALTKQWDEIRGVRPASDMLVLAKREGKSLDTVEGSIGAVDGERIDFKFDDVASRVNRAKVAGMVFFRIDDPAAGEAVCIVHGNNSLRAHVAEMALIDGILHMTTTAGAKLGWPADDVHFADFSAGKVVFLSDLEQVEDARTPLVAVPANADLAIDYDRPRRDQSAFGGPLGLWFPGTDWHAPAGDTKTFAKGVALRSRTEQVYRLPSGYTRLLGTAGIEPATRSEGAVQLRILGDDRPLLDTEVAGSEAPIPFDLDVAGVKRLKIVVDFGANLDTGDWLNLCDVRIIK